MSPLTAPQDSSHSDRANRASQLLATVRPGLQLVETKMKAVDSALFAPLAHAFLDLIGSGGKRLRPALALLSAEVAGMTPSSAAYPRVVALAAAVEMLHTATLVHDDVIDGAMLRRGAPTLNATWSGGSTVLAGNYMFGTAARFAAQTDDIRVIRLFSETLKIIVNGELRQLRDRYNYEQEKSVYYQRIYAKTASLFCAATEGAAILAGLSDAAVKQLRDYGYNFGMAFQIMDDVLDFTSDEATLGKPAGSDLRQGTVTLPFFYYLHRDSGADDLIAYLEEQRLRADEEDATIWDHTVAQVVQEVRATGGVKAARQEALNFLEQARNTLSIFADSPCKEALLGLCDYVVQRNY